MSWIGAGAAVWLLGRPELHIGASGLVFGYFGALLARGYRLRTVSSFALTGGLLWMFGSMLLGALPMISGSGISWEGHLSGFIAGFVVRVMMRRDKRYRGEPLNPVGQNCGSGTRFKAGR